MTCVAVFCVACVVAPPTASSHPRSGSSCFAAAVRQRVVTFIEAFNSGNLLALDELFAPPPEFQWYSSGKPGRRVKSEARNRETPISYFERRHAQKDRLKLLY